MSDIQLFRLQAGQATALRGEASDLEKPLQNLIEANLQVLLGIRLLASEYGTGKTHGGRIDTLGIDENHCPVIIEYKRSVGENVINQGLFYLDWLLDHRAEFKLLVLEQLGKPAADAIDWSAPRLVCIAADFTKYDGHAVQQIQRSIELMRYRRFGDDLLLLELAHAYAPAPSRRAASQVAVAAPSAGAVVAASSKPVGPDKAFADLLPALPPSLLDVLASLEDYTLSLGDDVQRKELRLYLAFKRIRNFASVVLQRSRLLLFLHLDASQSLPAIQAVLPAARDVSAIGHWGTGDVEIPLQTLADLDAAKSFIAQAYEGRSAVSA
jgi:predicted transport protein